MKLDSTTKKQYYWLDLLRFLAAFIVVLSHARMEFWCDFPELSQHEQTLVNSLIYILYRNGHEAVLIFFVMSGFLVGGKSFQKILSGSFDIKQYSIDRFVRISLPLISALILIYITNNIVKENPPRLIEYVGSLFSLQGVLTKSVSGPLWSLAFEVWFYVFMGCIGVLLTKNTKHLLKWGAMLLLTISCIVFGKLGNIHYLLIWLLGAFTLPLIARIKPKKSVLLIGLVFLFINWFFMKLTARESPLFPWLWMPSRATNEITFSFCICIILAQICIYKPKNKFSLKLNDIGNKLSKFSYTLYLTHYPVLYMLSYWGIHKCESITPYSNLLIISISAFCLLPAYLIYLMAEKHTSTVKALLKRIFKNVRLQQTN